MPDSARNIVFISYRRSDAKHLAGRICDRLRDAVGDRAEVFMDVDSSKPGKDFRTQIENAIKRSKVMIVVIGEEWLNAKKGDSRGWRKFFPWWKPPRRLDDPKDYVRKEIVTALQKEPIIIIIPVLVDDARMPVESELPEDIREVSYQPAVVLRHEKFSVDAPELMRAVLDALAEPDPPPAAPPLAAVPEKPAPALAKIGPAPATAPAPKQQESSQPAQPAAAPAPRRQPAPAKIIGTLAEERRKVLANLEQLHGAAVTCDPAIRKAAHLKYVTTLHADYRKEFGEDAFIVACISAVFELDAWREDMALMSRVRYSLPVFAVCCALACWILLGYFDIFHWFQTLMNDIVATTKGFLSPDVSLPSMELPVNAPPAPEFWLVRLLRPVLAFVPHAGTAITVLLGGSLGVMVANFPFRSWAEKWRVPNCDAAFARTRLKLDAPARVRNSKVGTTGHTNN